MKRIQLLLSCLLFACLYTGQVHAQCSPTLWTATTTSTNQCCGGTICNNTVANPAQWIANGVARVPGNLACNTSYYWTNFAMNGNLCITNNFAYEIRLRNSPTNGGIDAYDVTIQLTGSGISTGCTLIGGNGVNGPVWAQQFTSAWAGANTVTNNAALVLNLSNFNTIRLSYQNNVLQYSLNGTPFFQLPYTGNICNIQGIRISFKGSGEIDWMRVQDNTNTEVWREDFNAPCFNPFPACATPTISGSFTAPTCANNSLQLFASSNQLMSYSWTGPNGFTSNQQNPVISNPTAAANGNYTVTGLVNNCGTPVSTSVNVSFQPLALPVSNLPDTSLCKGDSIRLQAGGGSSYSWSPNYNISALNVPNPVVWPDQTTDYVVTISNGACSTLDTIRVTVNDCHCEDSCNWSLTGNTNVKGRNFIGSINPADFKIRTANIQRMVVSAAGNVGIGTAAPGSRFELNSGTAGLSGMRFTQPISLSAPNGQSLSVDGSGNVILVPAGSGGSGWNLDGNSVNDDCGAEFIGTNNNADFRFHAGGLHRMRLLQQGSLSLEPVCGANQAQENTNLLVGNANQVGKGTYNTLNGEAQVIDAGWNNLLTGYDNRLNDEGPNRNNLIAGVRNRMSRGNASVILGEGLVNTEQHTLHFGASGERPLVNSIPNTLMIGWNRLHTGLLNEEGVAIKTATTEDPQQANDDMATARLDVQASPYKSEVTGDSRPSGVRFRELPNGKGYVLVIDEKGYVYRTEQSALQKSENTEISALKAQVAQLQAQVNALLEARNFSPATDAEQGSALEVVPTPFDSKVSVVYALPKLTPGTVLKITDAEGRLIKVLPVSQSKGTIEVGQLSTSSSLVVFTLESGNKVLLSRRSVKL